MFKLNCFPQIWNEPRYKGKQKELLKLMMKFELCYKLQDADEYIYPQLLPAEKPIYEWEEQQNLILRFRYTFMPKGLISRFIVRIHRYIENHDLVWEKGVILAFQGAKAEVIETYGEQEIRVRAQGHEPRFLMTLIVDVFDRIHDTFHHLKLEKLIPCVCKTCKHSRSPHFYAYSNLIRRIQHRKNYVECDISYKNVSVHALLEGITMMRNGSGD